MADFMLSLINDGTASVVLTVPYGVNLTVTETDGQGYSTTTQVGTGTATPGITTGQLTITEAVTITFTNREVTVAPTGYEAPRTQHFGWLILIGVLLIAGTAIPLVWRRKRRYE